MKNYLLLSTLGLLCTIPVNDAQAHDYNHQRPSAYGYAKHFSQGYNKNHAHSAQKKAVKKAARKAYMQGYKHGLQDSNKRYRNTKNYSDEEIAADLGRILAHLFD